MDIHEIRRRNFVVLIDRKCDGTKKKMADRLGWKSQRVYQLSTNKNPKGMGGVAARNIENQFKLPRGWMDIPHQPLWTGESEILEDGGAYHLPFDENIRTLPLFSREDVLSWVTDGSAKPIARYRVPLDNLSRSAFLLLEETNMMLPVKAGDAYVVDPERKPKLQDVAVFSVDDIIAVGLFEKGLFSNSLKFPGTDENIRVSMENFCGTVVANIAGDFLGSIKD